MEAEVVAASLQPLVEGAVVGGVLADSLLKAVLAAIEVIPVVWTHLTMDFVDPGRCRSLWHGPRSTV
ncbi:hypothetical protein, partial [Streptomyces fagopyri]|uniref:hypothetical protein n=1 Tax=Streptomyces fagopyri TaxID=2662397 RepID=UPI0033FB400F